MQLQFCRDNKSRCRAGIPARQLAQIRSVTNSWPVNHRGLVLNPLTPGSILAGRMPALRNRCGLGWVELGLFQHLHKIRIRALRIENLIGPKQRDHVGAPNVLN